MNIRRMDHARRVAHAAPAALRHRRCMLRMRHRKVVVACHAIWRGGSRSSRMGNGNVNGPSRRSHSTIPPRVVMVGPLDRTSADIAMCMAVAVGRDVRVGMAMALGSASHRSGTAAGSRAATRSLLRLTSNGRRLGDGKRETAKLATASNTHAPGELGLVA